MIGKLPTWGWVSLSSRVFIINLHVTHLFHSACGGEDYEGWLKEEEEEMAATERENLFGKIKPEMNLAAETVIIHNQVVRQGKARLGKRRARPDLADTSVCLVTSSRAKAHSVSQSVLISSTSLLLHSLCNIANSPTAAPPLVVHKYGDYVRNHPSSTTFE